jgi:hypothetical protein
LVGIDEFDGGVRSEMVGHGRMDERGRTQASAGVRDPVAGGRWMCAAHAQNV